MSAPLVKLLKKIIRTPLLASVVIVLLFEEWGWEPLARTFTALGKLPCWATLERLITRLPPWAALVVFGIPVLVLVPVKLLALYLFGRGHLALGLLMVVMAKIMGTAMAARLFQLTQPTLMRLPWFARLYPHWKIWKDSLLNRVRASTPWKLAQRFKTRAKKYVRMAWRRLKAMVASAMA